MHYAVLGLGLLIGAVGLYRFFKVANPQQMAALLLSAVTVVLLVAVFFMAVTGRLPAALALLVALFPLVKGFIENSRIAEGDEGEGTAYQGRKRRRKAPPAQMGRKEALEVLGLSGNPNEEEILAAYKRLIRKAHPDQEGSAWLAAQINAARDILLDKSKN